MGIHIYLGKIKHIRLKTKLASVSDRCDALLTKM